MSYVVPPGEGWREPIVRGVADDIVGAVGTMSAIGEIGGIGREVIEIVLIGEIGRVAGNTSEFPFSIHPSA